MTKSLPLFVAIILLFPASPVFAEVHEVVTLDAKGNVAECVDAIKKYNEIARKVVPKNHPAIRVIQASFAGDQTGLLWMVVEYDDMADLARTASQMEGNEEVAAIARTFGQACPIVSQSLGEQLYYNGGTK